MALNTKAKNDTTAQSPVQIQNQSFDQATQVSMVEPVTINPVSGTLERPTAIQGNASITISNVDSVVASTKVITKTVGATNYTKTISYNAAGDAIAVSAWS